MQVVRFEVEETTYTVVYYGEKEKIEFIAVRGNSDKYLKSINKDTSNVKLYTLFKIFQNYSDDTLDRMINLSFNFNEYEDKKFLNIKLICVSSLGPEFNTTINIDLDFVPSEKTVNYDNSSEEISGGTSHLETQIKTLTEGTQMLQSTLQTLISEIILLRTTIQNSQIPIREPLITLPRYN